MSGFTDGMFRVSAGRMGNVMNDVALRHHIATEVKVAMVRAGVTQAQLARAIGRHRTTLAPKLAGERPFDTDDLALICEQLGCNVADLFPQANGEPVIHPTEPVRV